MFLISFDWQRYNIILQSAEYLITLHRNFHILDHLFWYSIVELNVTGFNVPTDDCPIVSTRQQRIKMLRNELWTTKTCRYFDFFLYLYSFGIDNHDCPLVGCVGVDFIFQLIVVNQSPVITSKFDFVANLLKRSLVMENQVRVINNALRHDYPL